MSLDKTVFVGNVPYDATKEELKDYFSQVGRVHSFDLKMDSDSGKSRGFGFCNYYDISSAESAIRNLGGKPFNGRPLKVVPSRTSAPASYHFKQSSSMSAPSMPSQMSGGYQSDAAVHPPKKTNVHGHSSSTEKRVQNTIRTVEEANPITVFNLLLEMKHFIGKQPLEARKLLSSQPQLCFALLKALKRLHLVDGAAEEKLMKSTRGRDTRHHTSSLPNTMPSAMTTATTSRPPLLGHQPQQPQQQQPQQQHYSQPPVLHPQHGRTGTGAPTAPSSTYSAQQQQQQQKYQHGYDRRPQAYERPSYQQQQQQPQRSAYQQQQQPPQQPPQPPQGQQGPPSSSAPSEQQRKVLEQVLRMTEEDLQRLAPERREQIIRLKQRYGATGTI
eukprot:m.4511 g.4511  ORF g.4511 m.4511 type:complete len:386 (+) comp3908_c0_seq1:42-1199(+)